jgi:hypothetical protein
VVEDLRLFDSGLEACGAERLIAGQDQDADNRGDGRGQRDRPR